MEAPAAAAGPGTMSQSTQVQAMKDGSKFIYKQYGGQSKLLWSLACFVFIVVESVCTGYLSRIIHTITVNGDINQQRAVNLLLTAAIVGWVGILSIIGLAAVRVYFATSGAEEGMDGGNPAAMADKISAKINRFLMVFFCAVGLLYTMTGVLASAAAGNLYQGPDYSENYREYVTCAVIGGVCVGSLGLMVVYKIVRCVLARRKKNASGGVEG